MEEKQEKDEFFEAPPAQIPAQQEQQQQKKKTKIKASSIILAVFIALVSFLGGWFGHYYSLDEEVRTFLWALNVSKKNYYRNVDEQQIYEGLYALLNLDPYSQLFSPDAYAQYEAEGKGQNIGVGISLVDETVEGVTIPRFFLVVENSPASRAGIRKGMYILGFGTEDSMTQGDSSALIDFLSQQSGAFVLRCGYELDGSDAEYYTLKRESYQASYVHYRDSETGFRYRYDENSALGYLEETNEPLAGLDAMTAYIRLDEFSGNAAEEFVKCLILMRERGREHLILDLRTNGGGFLSTLDEIAAHLLRNAEGNSPVVAKAVYRSGRTMLSYAEGNDFYSYFNENSRVWLLADEYTASASECLIGALVDYGTVQFSDIFLRQNADGVAKTYGKGIMQSHFMSLSGAAMKLTTAEIVWPKGKSIHGVGVIPEDGAIPVPADLIWGKSDPMLETVIETINK